jgi:CRP-like cAMP-binding protein
MLGITLPTVSLRPDPKVVTMRRLAGLESISMTSLRCLAAHTELFELPCGSRLTTQGRYVHMMFGIVEGTVDLYLNDQAWWTVRSGGWVGSSALARQCPAATTAVARGPVLAAVVGRADFRAYLAVPDLVDSLLR